MYAYDIKTQFERSVFNLFADTQLYTQLLDTDYSLCDRMWPFPRTLGTCSNHHMVCRSARNNIHSLLNGMFLHKISL